MPTLDPLSQDIWFTPIMSVQGHLWRAGNPVSVCGLPWSTASQAWTADTERPKEYCRTCSPDSTPAEPR
jgi:hypothetical protein